MSIPRVQDLTTYVGKQLTNYDWDANCQQLINFLTTTYDVTFGDVHADLYFGDVSNCTGFPTFTVTQFQAGEDITAGDIVRASGTEIFKADNTSSAGILNIVGVAVNSVTAGIPVTVERFLYDAYTGLTTDATYYVGTAGGKTITKPSHYAHPIGYALSTTTMFLGPCTEESQTFADLNSYGLTLRPFTQGSVLYVGASGVVSENNSQLFWSGSNLGIGTATPGSKLEVAGDIRLGIVGSDSYVRWQAPNNWEMQYSYTFDSISLNRNSIVAITTNSSLETSFGGSQQSGYGVTVASATGLYVNAASGSNGLMVKKSSTLFFNATQDSTTQYLKFGSSAIEIDQNGTNVMSWDTSGNVTIPKQIHSLLTTGTAPFIISSTTLNTNLNSDLLDGQDGTYYLNTSNMTTGTLAVNRGGTGQSSYTNGQLLIGNTSGNTLTLATLTGTANQIIITNGGGSITLSTPQSIATTSSPTFGNLTLNPGAANGISLSTVSAVTYLTINLQNDSGGGTTAAFLRSYGPSEGTNPARLWISNTMASSYILLTGGSGGNQTNFYIADPLQSTRISFFGLDSNTSSSGTNMIFIKNESGLASGNPSGGGLLYVSGGALKFKGSSGTVTTIAAA